MWEGVDGVPVTINKISYSRFPLKPVASFMMRWGSSFSTEKVSVSILLSDTESTTWKPVWSLLQALILLLQSTLCTILKFINVTLWWKDEVWLVDGRGCVYMSLFCSFPLQTFPVKPVAGSRKHVPNKTFTKLMLITWFAPLLKKKERKKSNS